MNQFTISIKNKDLKARKGAASLVRQTRHHNSSLHPSRAKSKREWLKELDK